MAVIRLSATAEADIVALLAWTETNFGPHACQRYEALLVTALQDLASDPTRHGTAARPELGIAVCSYHLRHSRKRARMAPGIVRSPRHLLLYRVTPPSIVEIARVLHDAMELERHLPEEFSGS